MPNCSLNGSIVENILYSTPLMAPLKEINMAYFFTTPIYYLYILIHDYYLIKFSNRNKITE